MTDEVLTGRWVCLLPLASVGIPELTELDQRLDSTPNMGGALQRTPEALARTRAIVRRSDRRLVGVISYQEDPLYPGVAVICLYLDQEGAWPGLALEAGLLFVHELLAAGIERVRVEVLEFNQRILRLLERAGWLPTARLRQHMYIGSRYWDLLIFSFDRRSWNEVLGRFAGRLPGRHKLGQLAR